MFFLDCICCGFGAIILLLVLTKIGEPRALGELLRSRTLEPVLHTSGAESNSNENVAGDVEPLVGAQSRHRRNARGAKSRDEAGGNGDEQQDSRRAHIGQGVARRDAEK